MLYPPKLPLGYPIPGHPLPGHPLPGHPLPGHPLPGHPLPGHPLPGQPLLGHPLPGCPLDPLAGPSVIASLPKVHLKVLSPWRLLSDNDKNTPHYYKTAAPQS